MIRKICMVMLLGIWFCSSVSAQEPKLKKAFNGKNFKGWVVPENNIWWSANKGILKAQSGPNKKGSILWTEKDYENFIIEVDFLFGEGTVDSGIFLRTEKQQIQIGISGSLKRDMTGSPYIPGKGYPVEAKDMDKILKPKEWNTIKVSAIGNIYKVWMNGIEVLNYESSDALKSGPIGLQLHPNKNMQISFRNIRIADLH